MNCFYSNHREWISPAFCTYMLDRLIRDGDSGLLKNFDVYLLPVANPDGYAYTWTGSRSRMWRKNRRPGLRPGGYQGPDGKGSKCWGTDPTRNFDIKHGHAGTSTSNDPCHDAYHGGKPFSDAESKAVRDALKTAMADHNKKVVYISVHAYGQLWIYPYGHTKSQSIHHSDLKSVATKAVQALQ